MQSIKQAPQEKLSIADKLRDAIRRSELTQAQIAGEAGVHESQISLFVRGAGLNIKTAERLIEHFGFRLEGPSR